jgi:hypothetical protein
MSLCVLLNLLRILDFLLDFLGLLFSSIEIDEFCFYCSSTDCSLFLFCQIVFKAWNLVLLYGGHENAEDISRHSFYQPISINLPNCDLALYTTLYSFNTVTGIIKKNSGKVAKAGEKSAFEARYPDFKPHIR